MGGRMGRLDAVDRLFSPPVNNEQPNIVQRVSATANNGSRLFRPN